MDSLLAISYGLHTLFQDFPNITLPATAGDNVCSTQDGGKPWDYGELLVEYIQQVFVMIKACMLVGVV